MEEHFPLREKSRNFDHTGKVREFYPKYWKNEEILTWENGNKYWKGEGNFSVRKSENHDNHKTVVASQKGRWEPCVT